jgi:formylglycine-generating enzyme required for sulfatase activity
MFATPDLMKDEGPQREVSIVPFLLARTEVTQAIWRGLAHLVGLPRDPSMFEHAGDRAPVEQVSWNHAQLWLTGVNDAFDLDLRLPSEAEWEYANRAGTTTPLYNGKYPDNERLFCPAVDEIAWYFGNASADYPGAYATREYASEDDPEAVGTQTVGGKKPNAFGLYDTLGNVYEWVADIAHGDYEGAPDDGRPWRGGETVHGSLLNGPVTAQGPIVTARDHTYVPGRIRRGGSWRNLPYNTRAAIRAYRGPNFSDGNNGFRVAVSVPEDLPEPTNQSERD